MTPALHFDNAFWSQKRPQEPLPDFQTGLSVLHSKLNQSKVENDELISFFKDRIAVEETYASRLADQAKTTLKPSGFGRDEGAGLKSCFENLRAASSRFGNQHKETANLMTETVLRPLQRLQEEYKRNILVSKQSVDAALKQFDSLVKDMDKARSTYQKKCRELKTVQEQVQVQQQQQQQQQQSDSTASSTIENNAATATTTSPTTPGDKKETTLTSTSSSETVILGNQQLPQPEFEALIRKMYNEIPVGDHRVPILGKYPNTSTGEDISVWLQQNLPQCKDSPAMAGVVAQQLIQPLGVLRLVGQRGNKFSSSAQSFYQWRFQQRDDESGASVSISGANAYAIAGFFERIGAVQSTLPGEDLLRRVQREVASADEAYRTSVKRIDQMRMAVEQAMFAHFAEMEQVELRRIGTIKEIFEAYSRCMIKLLPEEKAIIDDMMVYQESLKPEQDIQYIVQQYCVAGFGPKPILYENYANGVAFDQTFGVPLEDLGNQNEDYLPTFVRCALEAIEASKDTLNDQEKMHLWSTRVPLARVHTVRADLDVPSSQINDDLLKQHPPIMLVAILRLFLLELPEPLMTFDFYDAGQTLYSNSAQDESLRLLSLGNLIANLPGSHFETLRTLLKHIHSHVEKLQQDKERQEEIAVISQSLGPVMLRPRSESLTSLTSRVPASICQDLITHYNEIFNENTLKSHEESEKRRRARPLVASKSDYQLADASSSSNNSSNKKQQQQQPQQQRRGLMSFMRPSAAEDNSNNTTNKWSMRGVFQRASNGASSSDSSSDVQQQTRSSSSSFTRSTTMHMSGSAITQGSPPSSPPKTSEIVFDLADHVQQRDKTTPKEGDNDKDEKGEQQQGNNDNNDDDTKNQQDIHDKDELDPFFADED